MKVTRKAPPVGLDPHFDELVAGRLEQHDDFIQEEANNAWEMYSTLCGDAVAANARMEEWWESKTQELRDEAWNEYLGDPEDEEAFWEAISADVEANQESQSLTVEMAGEVYALQQRVKRERRRRKKIESQARELYEENQRLQLQLETWRAPKPCSCGFLSFTSWCNHCGQQLP